MQTERFLSRLIHAIHKFFVPYKNIPTECSHDPLLVKPPRLTKVKRCGDCGGMQLMAGTDLRQFLLDRGIKENG